VVTIVLVALVVVLAVALLVVVHRLRAGRIAAALELQRVETAAKARREHLEAEVEHLRRTGERHEEMLARLQRAWRAEREWARELRGQLARAAPPRHDEGPADVRDLVLEAAIKLVEGDRGLLLAREDADDDGMFDVVVARGFTHDPRRSAIAQRFAREVLERDVIVREDAPRRPAGDRTPADDEIESLVAHPLYLRDRFNGVVVCANRPGGFGDMPDDVLLALGDHAGAALQHGSLRRELDEARRAAVRVLVEAAAASRPLLHRESSRLVILALHLARDLELEPRERDVLVCALLLRAVGEQAIPDAILRNSGPLSPEERSLVELHPRIAFNVVGQAPELREVATTLLYHHERFDGGGYPAGLTGTDIPLASRALAVLEAFGAMTGERAYREPRPVEEACQELVAAAGAQFDPEVVTYVVEEIRRAPEQPSDVLVESVLEALPLEGVAAAGETLGPLGGPSTDGLTLLGDPRALHHEVREAVDLERPFAIALVQLEDLARINGEAGFVVGDRAIRLAARNAKRAAARLGGTAYRASGRRLAVVAPLREDTTVDRVRDELVTEFTGGPAIRVAAAPWQAQESAEDLLTRARRALD
jgi:GGDEF domain-containing protein